MFHGVSPTELCDPCFRADSSRALWDTLWDHSIPSGDGLTLAGNRGSLQSLMAAFTPPLQLPVYDSIFEASNQDRPLFPSSGTSSMTLWQLQILGSQCLWGSHYFGSGSPITPGKRTERRAGDNGPKQAASLSTSHWADQDRTKESLPLLMTFSHREPHWSSQCGRMPSHASQHDTWKEPPSTIIRIQENSEDKPMSGPSAKLDWSSDHLGRVQ